MAKQVEDHDKDAYSILSLAKTGDEAEVQAHLIAGETSAQRTLHATKVSAQFGFQLQPDCIGIQLFQKVGEINGLLMFKRGKDDGRTGHRIHDRTEDDAKVLAHSLLSSCRL